MRSYCAQSTLKKASHHHQCSRWPNHHCDPILRDKSLASTNGVRGTDVRIIVMQLFSFPVSVVRAYNPFTRGIRPRAHRWMVHPLCITALKNTLHPAQSPLRTASLPQPLSRKFSFDIATICTKCSYDGTLTSPGASLRQFIVDINEAC